MKGLRFILALEVCLLTASIAEAEGAPFRGTIRDKKTGAPLAGVSVYVTETGDVAVTDEAGRFEFPELSEGTWHVVAIDPAYEKKEEILRVPKDSKGSELELG